MEPPNGMSAHDGHGRASRPVCAAAVFAIIVPGLRAVLLVAEVVSLAKRRHGSCCSNQVCAVAPWQVSCSARLRPVSSCHDSCANKNRTASERRFRSPSFTSCCAQTSSNRIVDPAQHCFFGSGAAAHGRCLSRAATVVARVEERTGVEQQPGGSTFTTGA